MNFNNRWVINERNNTMRILPFLLFLFSIAQACSQSETDHADTSTDSDTATTDTDADTDVGSSGCGQAVANTDAYTVTDGDRTYLVALPDGYDPKIPYPLVVAFHGGGDTGDGFRGWAGVEEAAAGQAIFVYPTGPDGIWNDEVFNSDFDLFDRALESLSSQYCVDLNAVFAFGFSWGGWAVTQFACARPNILKGIASIAGGGPMGNCTQPMAMMLIHGTADKAEPISSSESTRDQYVQNNGCADTFTDVAPSPCVSYSGCDEAVVWCAHDGEHGIPSFAPEAVWDFFNNLR
jgi:polyhydroxybutyrate depolymerase